jgi:Zn finger protein HypA/HybF involved in hydrogenase expression
MSKASKYSKEVLAPIVKASTSVSEVVRKLGLNVNGGTTKYIGMRIAFLGLSKEHFLGRGWSKGASAASSEAVAAVANKLKRPNELIFIENAPPVNGTTLKKRLLEMGRSNACAECGLTLWRKKAITLHVDHINGVNNDNRIENLRFLCPNCHQQTDTWGNGEFRTKELRCPHCGATNKTGARQTKYCRLCQSGYFKKNGSMWPTTHRLKFEVDRDTLSKEVWETPLVVLCKKYGVTDNSIRKRCQKLGIELPKHGHWQREKAKRN